MDRWPENPLQTQIFVLCGLTGCLVGGNTGSTHLGPKVLLTFVAAQWRAVVNDIVLVGKLD